MNTRTKALVLTVFVSAVAIGFAVGSWAGGSSDCGTTPGTARAGTILPPARSLQGVGGVQDAGRSGSSSAPAAGDGDMANGSPAALSSELRFGLALSESIRIGGGDRATSAQTPTPASTTVTQALETGTVAPRLPPTPTVIISAMTPAAVAQRSEQPTPNRQVEGSSPSSGASLEAQVRAAVVAYFPPAQVETAMRVAYCESRYQPWAAEPGGAHHGVFQVADSIWGAVPSDVDSQVRQAAVVWRAGGWGMWSCN